MSNVSDKSYIHRSYPKLAYGSIYITNGHSLGLLVSDFNGGFLILTERKIHIHPCMVSKNLSICLSVCLLQTFNTE